ncbi:hypothetical protein H6P81_006464 [Aristolochia fimbriata]|uniref:BZIP domain-containing protein n=1 Tax=Aristolochia fimbriata TaxID=158543 RepID=A0AAV7EXD5_ARIFI|nr:hypothetical protein H6P81_006464 [Aristolochia fimbriata]
MLKPLLWLGIRQASVQWLLSLSSTCPNFIANDCYREKLASFRVLYKPTWSSSREHPTSLDLQRHRSKQGTRVRGSSMASSKGKALQINDAHVSGGLRKGRLAAGGRFVGSSSNNNNNIAQKSSVAAAPEGGNVLQLSGRKNKVPPSDAVQMDAKKMKRLMANREAGKRCRMKKYGYVLDLEQKTILLQESLKLQRPQLQYFDRYISVMKIENDALRAQINNICQANTIREAELASLTKERNALKVIFDMQIQQEEYIQYQQREAEQFILAEPYGTDFGTELANIINMDDFSSDQIKL